MSFDYMTTSQKKKCLLILNLVKALVMVDYVTTSKKKNVRLDFESEAGALTTRLQAKKKVSLGFERCCWG